MTPPSAERQSTLQDRSSFFPLPPPSSSVPSPSPSPSSSAFARLVHERVSTRPLAMASETHLTIFLFEKRLLTSTLIPATGTCRQPPPLRTPSSPSLPLHLFFPLPLPRALGLGRKSVIAATFRPTANSTYFHLTSCVRVLILGNNSVLI